MRQKNYGPNIRIFGKLAKKELYVRDIASDEHKTEAKESGRMEERELSRNCNHCNCWIFMGELAQRFWKFLS
jgi:hypothetical protein